MGWVHMLDSLARILVTYYLIPVVLNHSGGCF